jgi:hypothetical protein
MVKHLSKSVKAAMNFVIHEWKFAHLVATISRLQKGKNSYFAMSTSWVLASMRWMSVVGIGAVISATQAARKWSK